MKVCFCVHRLPYPPVAGGKRETYKIIEGLADRGHELDVIAYAADLDRAAEMEREVGCSLTVIPGVPDRTPANLFRNLFSPDPLPVMKSRSEQFEREVRRRTSEVDIVHLHALQMAYLASELDTNVPTVLRFNNIKYEIYRQFAKHTRNPAKALYAYLQYVKTKRYEISIPEVSDLTLTITDEDRERLQHQGATGHIDVLPAGVDVSRFAPSDGDSDDRTVTFFGSMDYHPNEDAAIWFATEVFPRIQREFDNITFDIVGKNPPPSVRKLADRPDVRVTGFVEEIRNYIDRATVIVLPIRVGTGVRMKALHAMAMAKPIVSTSIGMQGIHVETGRHAVIADTETAFARSVIELLADPERREQYGRHARAFVEANHDWATILRQLETHYENVIGNKVDTAGGTQ